MWDQMNTIYNGLNHKHSTNLFALTTTREKQEAKCVYIKGIVCKTKIQSFPEKLYEND